MADGSGQITLREVRILLNYFRKLQKIASAPLPDRNDKLWEQAKQEARQEFIEDVQRRSRGMTIRPSGAQQIRENARIDSKLIDDRIEERAGKKYPNLDPKYALELNRRKQRAEELVRKIDHLITAIGPALRVLPLGDGTLLDADWRQLRERFSIDEILRLEKEEAFARTITSLETMKWRLRQRPDNRLTYKIKHFLLDLFERFIAGYFRSQS